MTVPLVQPAAVESAVAEAVVLARKLEKTISERRILFDLDFAIQAGEYVALLGANGAGKSTLLKVLATLIAPSGGELQLLGRSLTRDPAGIRARIGLIGHQSMLYRDLSARENLEFFAQLYGLPHPVQRAKQMLQAVDLLHRAEDPIKAFSRGMTQRVAIARALLHDPQLLLADEPFAGLDVPSTQTVERLLGELNAAGKTIVLVNHDIAQSLRLSRRTLVLRRGRLVIDRPSAELDVPAVLAAVGVS